MTARLGTVKTNLTWLLQQLLDASVVEREIPYGEGAVVSEVKWKRVQAAESAEIKQRLAQLWNGCALSRRFSEARFEVVDASALAQIGGKG